MLQCRTNVNEDLPATGLMISIHNGWNNLRLSTEALQHVSHVSHLIHLPLLLTTEQYYASSFPHPCCAMLFHRQSQIDGSMITVVSEFCL